MAHERPIERTHHTDVFDATETEVTTDRQPFEPFDENLWLDRLALRVGFDRLSSRLLGDVLPSYLFTVVLIATYGPDD